jgi:hypothetical protein
LNSKLVGFYPNFFTQLAESEMNHYDIVFTGHVTVDQIEALEGSAHDVAGAAPFSEHLLPARQRRGLPLLQE